MVTETKIKVGGVWEPITAPQVKVGGVWKTVNSIMVRVAGVWEEVLQSVFLPTILGDSNPVIADVVVEADGSSTEVGPASADADTHLWVIASGGEIYLRVAGEWGGDTGFAEWFNPAHVSQGAPDTNRVPGTDVFLLGDRTGVTVNIYTLTLFTEPGLTWNKIGTFTDDDKSTFFALTNDVQYGYQYSANADDPGNDTVGGISAVQFTFRKAGLEDYTIIMSMACSADATDDS